MYDLLLYRSAQQLITLKQLVTFMSLNQLENNAMYVDRYQSPIVHYYPHTINPNSLIPVLVLPGKYSGGLHHYNVSVFVVVLLQVMFCLELIVTKSQSFEITKHHTREKATMCLFG